MEEEERRREKERIGAETGLPVFRVSELLYCPMYRTVVPSYVVQNKASEGVEAHRAIQRHFMEKNKGHEIEAEKQLVLKRDGYVLMGHADLVDHTELMVYEIKPAHLGDLRYLLQLSAYVMMLRELTGRDYYGAFIAYKTYFDGVNTKVRYSVIRPFYIVTYVLDILDKVAEARIGRGDSLRIGGDWCKKCIWSDECTPHVRFVKRHGFIEVEKNE